MSGLKIAGIVLLVCGALSLAYGGFSYTTSRSDVDLGPVSFQVTESERVNIPVWLGAALIVAGGALLVGAGRSRM